MIKLCHEIPKSVTVAVSGGPDSMALLDFCVRGKRNVSVLNFHHGTDFSETAGALVEEFCKKRELKFARHYIEPIPHGSGMSKEEYWSGKRREVYNSVGELVLTGHNLDDAVEWWLMSCLRGSPKLMPVSNGVVARPFLLTKKATLVEWCNKRLVPYVVDPTNLDGSNDRSKIRGLIHHVEGVNPGIRTTIRNLYNSTGV